MDVPLLDAYQDWYCPNCGAADQSRPLPPNATRFHRCGKLHGLTAPMIRAGVRCKVEALDREDYQGREWTHPADDGRVYMSVVTTRDDGTDCAVLAPTAHATITG